MPEQMQDVCVECGSPKHVGHMSTCSLFIGVDVVGEERESLEHREIIDRESLERALESMIEDMKVIEKLGGMYCGEEYRKQEPKIWQRCIDSFCESKWCKYISEHYLELSPNLVSGSSSGSLPGFVRLRGLVPTGSILRDHPEVVPFSGELSIGASSHGVNNARISLSPSVQLADRYSRVDDGWSMGKSAQIISETKDLLQRRLREVENGKGSDDVLRESGELNYAKLFTDSLRVKIEIEERRQVLWDTLDSTEKAFVSHPFSLIYGIKQEGSIFDESRYEYFGSDAGGPEIIHKGKISIDDQASGRFILFCPSENIEALDKYLKQKNISISIHPIEALRVASYVTTFYEEVENKRKHKKTQEIKD
jgi:hypothetical protein